MGDLLTIRPKLKFPSNVPFETTDKFNGPNRGTWWFNDGFTVKGPYWTHTQASEAIDDSTFISPYQDQYKKWWWSDENQCVHGPYNNLRDADASIVEYNNKELK